MLIIPLNLLAMFEKTFLYKISKNYIPNTPTLSYACIQRTGGVLNNHSTFQVSEEF